jgi:hypothetical protein
MYLDIINYNMVGYATIMARDMLDHLFETYGNITAVDLEINFENMRRVWDPQQPAESLFKQIQDYADYSEAGGRPHWPPKTNQRRVFKDICNGSLHERMPPMERENTIEKTWTQFKSHFAAAHRQYKQMQGESADTAGYHSANAAVAHTEDQMAEATIGALTSLSTATAADRGVVAALNRPLPVWPSSWRKTLTSCGT